MYVRGDVPAHEHGVEHDPQAPHVRRTPRVLGIRPDTEKKQKLVTSKVFVTGISYPHSFINMDLDQIFFAECWMYRTC
jgi:hypothetical protein